MNTNGTTRRGMSRVSRYLSADAGQFLLVRGVVAKDESARPDDRRVALGSAPAGPQFDMLRKVADDRAKLALPRLPRRCRRQPQHEHLCALRALDDFACGQ